MKKYILPQLILLFLVITHICYAEDTTKVAKKVQKSYLLGQERSFENIEQAFNKYDFNNDILVSTLIDSNRITTKARKQIQRARAVMTEIKNSQAYTSIMNVHQIAKLPMGISKKIGNTDYTIGIDSIVFTPNYAYLVAYMIVKNPKDDSELCFVASDIRINKDGGFTGNAKLELVADYTFNLGGNPKNGTTQITFKGGSNKTYAEWDCGGFKRLAVQAEMVFSRDLLLVENANGNIDSTKRVKGTFSAQVEDWSELIATVNFEDDFQLRKLKGVGFKVKQATFDFSETQNPASMVFPADYFSSGEASNLMLWEGFYLKSAEVRLPRHFKKKNPNGTTTVASGGRLKLFLDDIIIDKVGFSGKLVARNIISLAEGDMKTWSYSLDSIGITLVKNQLVNAGFRGDLVLPISGENESLRYNCLIDPQNNDYQFSVVTRSDMTFPIWKAGQVEIFSGSSLEVRVVNDEFRPKATLNGKMTINASMSSGNSEKNKFKLAEMGFQQLVISTQAPYITVGSLSFGSDVTVKQIKVSGFPASLENIGFVNYTNGIALEMDLVVNFVGDAGGAFGADAHIRVIGERDETASKIAYKFKTIEVDRVHIEIEQGSFSLEGDLFFFKNDTIYGNGFQGNIEARFPTVEKIQVIAIFGNMLDNTRYWLADALVVLTNGITIAPGIEINGFGGGAYYHMKQAPKTAANENGLGVTPSGVAYVPDKNAGLGIRATVYVASSGSAQAFNGSVTLDISFFASGGLSRVILSGEASFLTPPLNIDLSKIKAKAAKIAAKAQQLEEAMGKVPGLSYDKNAVANINEAIHKLEEGNSKPGAVRATIVIDFDVAQKSLHCNLKLFVDVAGGLITGAGAGGLAGDVVLHFSPGKWYIHLGTTSQRMGMKLLGLAQTSAYLMAGDEIDAIPPPPAQVASILNEMDLSLGRNSGLIAQGKGFAMGMGLSVDTGDLTFLMFYGRFAAGLGFDMTLRNYGDGAVCEETNQKVGFDGWYAMGQVYAYVMGKIGVRVDLMFYKGDFEILSIAAAAILQAKLPNPTWMKGIVGGNFSILGGLVEGSCKFKFEIGKQCTIRGASLLSGIEVIAQLTPAEGADKLDVFTSPQAVFNYEIDKNFNVNDPDLGIIRTFRVKLDKFEVSKSGVLVPGRLEWSADNKTAAYISHDILPGQSSLQVVCRIYFQEFVRGAWTNVVVSGVVVEEIKRANFNTDKAPDYIPLSNVVYSYPIMNQLYYHKGETNVSYIKLDRGQPDLFVLDNKWNQEIRLTNGTTKLTAGLTYNTADKEVSFTMPANVQNGKLYRWEIMNTPAYDNDDVNANVSQVVNKTSVDSTNISIKTQKATGSLEQLQEKSIFTTNFASSSHSKFIDKFNAINRSSGWSWPIMAGIHEIGVNISGAELFDNAEILGNASKQVKPLVQLEAQYTTYWHTSMLQPTIYAGLSSGLQITHRNPNILGAPPVRNVLIGQSKLDWQLTAADVDAGNIPLGSSNGVFVYKMAEASFGDFTALRNQVAMSGNTSSFAQQLLITPFPTMQSGNYPVFLRYSLPGRNIVTSQVQIIINRP